MIEEAWYQVGEEELETPICTNNLFEIQIQPKSNGKSKHDKEKHKQEKEKHKQEKEKHKHENEKHKHDNGKSHSTPHLDYETCNGSSNENSISLVCPSSSCFYVLNSIDELSNHVGSFHKFTCNIPNCTYTTSCLCKLSDHIKKIHCNYKKLPCVPSSNISKIFHESKPKTQDLPSKRSNNLESHATEILNRYSNQGSVVDLNDPLAMLKKRK